MIVEPMNGYHFKVAHGKCSKCGAVGFTTKNIDYFGARTIFDHGGGCDWMKNRNRTRLCHDSAHLVVDEEAHKHVSTCKRCQEYGY